MEQYHKIAESKIAMMEEELELEMFCRTIVSTSAMSEVKASCLA
jgi:hypothetical protein